MALVVLSLTLPQVSVALKAGDCEVGISVLDRFCASLSKEEPTDVESIETSFKKFCKPLKRKENRFCYY